MIALGVGEPQIDEQSRPMRRVLVRPPPRTRAFAVHQDGVGPLAAWVAGLACRGADGFGRRKQPGLGGGGRLRARARGGHLAAGDQQRRLFLDDL